MNSTLILFFQNVSGDGDITYASALVDSKHADIMKRRESINDFRAQLKLTHEKKEKRKIYLSALGYPLGVIQ
jgi:hypothetical protein